MKITKQARREAKELFRVCQAGGVLDEARVRQAVEAVITRKPRGYLAVLSHFQRLVRLEVERHSARVESATPLDAALQQSVQARLQGLYGASLQVEFAQNEALIGGLRIRVGSDVYDGSVQGRLQQLKESF